MIDPVLVQQRSDITYESQPVPACACKSLRSSSWSLCGSTSIEMGLIFSRPTTNPGPREPDLGCNGLEIDDGELTESYIEVSYPLDIRVIPASPNSSWLNLVFNDHKDSRRTSNAEPPNEGIYRQGNVTPRTPRLSTAPESLIPPRNLPGVTLSSPAQNSLLTLSMEERRSRGVAIADTLEQLITELVDTINPTEAACSLYGVGIISGSERDDVTTESIDRKQRSNALIKNLIKKLKENPHWFKDACKALENTGARSIVEKLRAMVKEKWLEQSIDIEETSKFKFDGDSLTAEGVHSGRDVDDDDDVVLMLPSSQLAELDQAYKSGGQDAARQLLQSQSMDQNNQLLQDACKEGVDTSILELLLSESPSSCDVNGRDKHGRTCLHTICAAFPKGKDAATRFRTEEQLMKLWKLLDSGADSRIQDEDGNTPLHMAISTGNLEVSKVLLKHTPDLINIQNNDGRTVLHTSTMNQLPALTAELVKTKCCDPYLCDKEEKTPLHYASSSGMVSLVEPLLGKSHSTDFVNATDNNGDSALHIAAGKGDKKVVKILLKYGADEALKNNDGQTPFEVASDRRNYKAIKVLLKKKYPVRWRFKLQKLNVKRSSSLTRLPTSPSTNSVNSDAESSVCSEINVTTTELDD